jgi:hypothetical protein
VQGGCALVRGGSSTANLIEPTREPHHALLQKVLQASLREVLPGILDGVLPEAVLCGPGPRQSQKATTQQKQKRVRPPAAEDEDEDFHSHSQNASMKTKIRRLYDGQGFDLRCPLCPQRKAIISGVGFLKHWDTAHSTQPVQMPHATPQAPQTSTPRTERSAAGDHSTQPVQMPHATPQAPQTSAAGDHSTQPVQMAHASTQAPQTRNRTERIAAGDAVILVT